MCILYKYLLYIGNCSDHLFFLNDPVTPKSTIASPSSSKAVTALECAAAPDTSHASPLAVVSGLEMPCNHRRPQDSTGDNAPCEVWEMWRQPHFVNGYQYMVFYRKYRQQKPTVAHEWYRVMVWKTAFSSTWRFILVHKWLIAMQESSNVIICYEMF